MTRGRIFIRIRPSSANIGKRQVLALFGLTGTAFFVGLLAIYQLFHH